MASIGESNILQEVLTSVNTNQDVTPQVPNPLEVQYEKNNEKVQIMREHRINVLKEIIVTEQKYVSDLSVIVCLFLKPLQVETFITKDDISTIFLNIEKIWRLSNDFLAKLENVVPDRNNIDPEVQLGNIVSQIVGSFITAYSAYCSSYKTSMEHSTFCAKMNNSYDQFLKETQAMRACKGLTLHDYLIKPVQRLCKYPLMFGELAKCTPMTHPDYTSVISTQALFQSVAEIANNISADKENMEKISLFLLIVDGLEQEANRFNSGKQLIRDDWLSISFPRNFPVINHVYLFTDQLVITKKNPRKSINKSLGKAPKSEKLRIQLFFENFELRDIPFDEQLRQHTFMFIPTDIESDAFLEADHCYSFHCPTAGVKTQWMDDLKRYMTMESFERINNNNNKENIAEDNEKRSRKRSTSSYKKSRREETPLVRSNSIRFSPADRSLKKLSKQFGPYFSPNTPESINNTTPGFPIVSPSSPVHSSNESEKTSTSSNDLVLPIKQGKTSGFLHGSGRAKKNSEPARVLSFILNNTNNSKEVQTSPGCKATEKPGTSGVAAGSNGESRLPELPRKIRTKSQPRRAKIQSVRIQESLPITEEPNIRTPLKVTKSYNNNPSSSTKKHKRSKTHDMETSQEINSEIVVPSPPTELPPPLPSLSESIPIVNQPILSCHRCNIEIPADVSSMIFQNKTFHCKCYYCSSCKISLMDSRAYNHQNDLYCSDCIHNV